MNTVDRARCDRSRSLVLLCSLLCASLSGAGCAGPESGPLSDAGADADSDAADGTGDVGAPYDWFVQPVAGLLLGTTAPRSASPVETIALHAFAGSPEVFVVPVPSGSSSDRSGAEPPVVTGVDRARVAPMQRLVISGERIRTDGVAISAWFEVDGAVGVAVPAIAISATSVEVSVPALFDAQGNNVGGTARVRIWQASSDGLAVSAPFDGVEVEPLPDHPGGTPGVIFAAWLHAAIGDVSEVGADEDLEVSARYRSTMAELRTGLEELLRAVDLAIDDPETMPLLPWTAGEPPPLTPTTLKLADRIVIATVTALVDELERADDATAKSAVRELRQALEDCRRQSHLPELDAQICDLQRGIRVESLGRQLWAWGARFVMSFHLGVIGGAGSAVASARSTEAAIAWEMAFAAGSGHVVSWATGTPPPTHAETQASVAVALVDRLAEAQGMLGAVYSALVAEQELDLLIRQWRERIDDPIDGPDAGDAGDAGDADDAGYDGPADERISGVYEGSLVHTVVHDEPSSGCQTRVTLTLHVTLGSAGGSGTDADPYTGDADVFGRIDTARTGPYEHCAMTSTVDVPLTETRVEGEDGYVQFGFAGDVGFEVDYHFGGFVEADTIVDDLFSFSARPPRQYGASYLGTLVLVRQ